MLRCSLHHSSPAVSVFETVARSIQHMTPSRAFPVVRRTACQPATTGASPRRLAVWRPAHRAAAGAAGRRPTQNTCDPGNSVPLLELQPGHVHVWWLSSPATSAAWASGQSLDDCCASLLTPQEVAECGTAGDDESRSERLRARAFLRSVLARYAAPAGCTRRQAAGAAAALRFERNAHGKPHLVWPTSTHAGRRLCFNLTHTGGLVGVAVGVQGVVGLDAEVAGRRTRGDPLRLARRRFSQEEAAELEALDDGEERAAYFLMLWTLKEAYVKAVGRGIAAPPGLRSFSFRVTPSGSSVALPGPALRGGEQGDARVAAPLLPAIAFSSSAPEPLHRWDFLLMRPSATHLAALCFGQARDSPPLELTAFQADALLHEQCRVPLTLLAAGGVA